MAAITFFDRPDGEPEALVSACPLPVGVVDLAHRTLVAMSQPMAMLLGFEDAPAHPVELDVVSDRADIRGTLFELLQSGAIDMYAGSRTLHRLGGEPLAAENWLVTIEPDERRRALWLVVPLDGKPVHAIPGQGNQDWPQEVAGLVVGSFTADLLLGRVSVDAQTVLGYPAGHLLGTSLSDLIHPEDLPDLFATMGACLADGAGVGSHLRVRNHRGDWVGTRWIITPVVNEQLRFGFAFTTSRAGHADEEAGARERRLAAMEQHLWRIAQEVQASGIVGGFSPTAVPPEADGLGNLSPRQWEVLTRLLHGERVPTIARGLYLSQSTVRNHLSDMFRKLGVRSQEELLTMFRPGGRGSRGTR